MRTVVPAPAHLRMRRSDHTYRTLNHCLRVRMLTGWVHCRDAPNKGAGRVRIITSVGDRGDRFACFRWCATSAADRVVAGTAGATLVALGGGGRVSEGRIGGQPMIDMPREGGVMRKARWFSGPAGEGGRRLGCRSGAGAVGRRAGDRSDRVSAVAAALPVRHPEDTAETRSDLPATRGPVRLEERAMKIRCRRPD